MKRTNDINDHMNELNNAGIHIAIMGVVGNWRFIRNGSYWSATCNYKGLKLDKANALYDKKYPYEMFDDCHIKKYGEVIRVIGHASPQLPEDWVEFDRDEVKYQLEKLDMDMSTLSRKQIKDMIRNKTIKADLFINCYHIDTQEGLNEFVRAITES